jgi:hypothetical protein
MKNFVQELKWRGMIQDIMPGTEEKLMEGSTAAYVGIDPTALALLQPYEDYNTAVAYMGMDRNLSALQILEKMEKTSQVNYLLAIIYSRTGDPQKAVQCYMSCCKEDRSYVHRGNLDPEISVLIKTYGLNQEPEDDLDLYY